MRNVRGLSLIEITLSLIILAATSTVIMMSIASQNKNFARSEKKTVLLSILSQTTTEINGKRSQDLPAVGNCMVRYYSAMGGYLSEEPVAALSNSLCQDDYPSDDRIKTIIRIEPSTAINASFTPAAFLKLPTQVSTLKLVQISVALGKQPNEKGLFPPISLTIFRNEL